LKNSISEDTIGSGQLSDKELKDILQSLGLLLSRTEEALNVINKMSILNINPPHP